MSAQAPGVKQEPGDLDQGAACVRDLPTSLVPDEVHIKDDTELKTKEAEVDEKLTCEESQKPCVSEADIVSNLFTDHGVQDKPILEPKHVQARETAYKLNGAAVKEERQELKNCTVRLERIDKLVHMCPVTMDHNTISPTCVKKETGMKTETLDSCYQPRCSGEARTPAKRLLREARTPPTPRGAA
ncbi:uncharacterized protein LOC134676774 [Cydia fagiglandana]|uniref:uncharacterized protein LOC134676774 n=1 Tax=Cydia fagiglandana TaxID=1458189 RepID=UPI002FEE4A57